MCVVYAITLSQISSFVRIVCLPRIVRSNPCAYMFPAERVLTLVVCAVGMSFVITTDIYFIGARLRWRVSCAHARCYNLREQRVRVANGPAPTFVLQLRTIIGGRLGERRACCSGFFFCSCCSIFVVSDASLYMIHMGTLSDVSARNG